MTMDVAFKGVYGALGSCYSVSLCYVRGRLSFRSLGECSNLTSPRKEVHKFDSRWDQVALTSPSS